jgi:predicted transcriptional regulator YdeE
MNADYKDIWGNQFMPHHDAVRRFADGDGYYGVYFPSDEPGQVDFIAGMAADASAEASEGLVLRGLPGGQYAVVECAMEAIAQTWQTIYGEWLPKSDAYAADEERPCFEHFPPGADQGKVPLSIYVAVKGK